MYNSTPKSFAEIFVLVKGTAYRMLMTTSAYLPAFITDRIYAIQEQLPKSSTEVVDLVKVKSVEMLSTVGDIAVAYTPEFVATKVAAVQKSLPKSATEAFNMVQGHTPQIVPDTLNGIKARFPETLATAGSVLAYPLRAAENLLNPFMETTIQGKDEALPLSAMLSTWSQTIAEKRLVEESKEIDR